MNIKVATWVIHVLSTGYFASLILTEISRDSPKLAFRKENFTFGSSILDPLSWDNCRDVNSACLALAGLIIGPNLGLGSSTKTQSLVQAQDKGKMYLSPCAKYV